MSSLQVLTSTLQSMQPLNAPPLISPQSILTSGRQLVLQQLAKDAATAAAKASSMKPTTTVIGDNVLLKQLPSVSNTPLPTGNSGQVLPAGVQPTDLPKTALLPDTAFLAPSSLTPNTTRASLQNPTPATTPEQASSGTLGFLGMDFSSPKTWGILLVVLVLLVVAVKHHRK